MKKVSIIFFISVLSLFSNFSGTNQLKAQVLDASSLDWCLWCYRPNVWRMNFNFEQLSGDWAEYSNIPMRVPGSVQSALRDAGIIEDWNVGLNSYKIEWIENRHWLVTAKIPEEWLSKMGGNIYLDCNGLDYSGIVMINGKEAGRFENAFLPYSFLISPFLKESDNTVAFIFECPPGNLAQIGWTSQIRDWKPRFNYGWDWTPRIIQTGIWDKVLIRSGKDDRLAVEDIKIIPSADKVKDIGALSIRVKLNKRSETGKINVLLTDSDGKKILEETLSAQSIVNQGSWSNLKVKRWWPNGIGQQPLYNLQITLLDEKGNPIGKEVKRVGFRYIEWLSCKGAPVDADPWICSINNQPIFLQGVNWTPIRPNFADLQEDDYRKRMQLYRNMGINTIRIWGGGFPEKEWLYDLCDEMGILIWQDFPLSSSGLDNYPPDDLSSVFTMSQIVDHYVTRLHHHAGLLLWCGGNELYRKDNLVPITNDHIMIRTMRNRINQLDPSRRFVVATPSGPNIYGEFTSFGKGINWDVHGPWNLPYTETDKTLEAVKDYWSKDDAMFRSEVGVPGTMSVEGMNKYKGSYSLYPASVENPLWRSVNWWVQWDEYKSENRDTGSIEDYVNWSQERQTEGLTIALKKSKERFPACGGFIIWMGHDSFPCMINTSIIDFDSNPKPVVEELSKILKDNSYLDFNKIEN